jgi:hypothetical protein
MSNSRIAEKDFHTLRRKRRRLDEAPLQRADRSPAYSAANAALAHPTAADARHSAMRELQQSNGNQHVQRLLARQQQDSASTAAAPPAPQVRETDFGTYFVFPDDQPLSLGMAQDPKREWPISQKMADRYQQVGDALKSGSTKFEFKGGAAFKAALLLDLEWLIKQPNGRELLGALARAGKKLTIEYAPDGGEPRAVAEGDAMARPDGTPGPGSEVQLRYAPEPWMPQGGQEAWERRKPAEGLARMLIGALPMLMGTNPSTREREPVTRNAQATGQDRLKRAIELENKLRGAFGMPLRAEE